VELSNWTKVVVEKKMTYGQPKTAEIFEKVEIAEQIV